MARQLGICIYQPPCPPLFLSMVKPRRLPCSVPLRQVRKLAWFPREWGICMACKHLYDWSLSIFNRWIDKNISSCVGGCDWNGAHYSCKVWCPWMSYPRELLSSSIHANDILLWDCGFIVCKIVDYVLCICEVVWNCACFIWGLVWNCVPFLCMPLDCVLYICTLLWNLALSLLPSKH